MSLACCQEVFNELFFSFFGMLTFELSCEVRGSRKGKAESERLHHTSSKPALTEGTAFSMLPWAVLSYPFNATFQNMPSILLLPLQEVANHALGLALQPSYTIGRTL